MNYTKDDKILKYDEGKPEYSVLPYDAIEEVIQVFEYGADKYHAPLTYREGIPASKLVSAGIRHFVQWFYRREEEDHESGCHHLAHAAANALMLLSMLRYNRLNPTVLDKIDNRPSSISLPSTLPTEVKNGLL